MVLFRTSIYRISDVWYSNILFNLPGILCVPCQKRNTTENHNSIQNNLENANAINNVNKSKSSPLASPTARRGLKL